ncbi:MAG: preprotein translocase subunit SecG [Flavisolibacter sp.]
MTILFLILVIVACIILSLIVLVQNPKGGGLAGSFAGFNSQFMGVKQTNDVLERGTWIFAAVIGILCIVSTLFIPGSRRPSVDSPIQNNAPMPPPANTPANTVPVN